MDIHQIDWSQVEWKHLRPGVAQKAFSGAGATIAMHRMEPGNEPRPHKHEHEQLAYIASGTCDFHVGDQVVRMGPGSVIAIPPDVMHHLVVVGDEVVINIDVFTPARPEYAPQPGA